MSIGVKLKAESQETSEIEISWLRHKYIQNSPESLKLRQYLISNIIFDLLH